MLHSVGGLRFMTAPEPRCVSINVLCGGIIDIGGWHSPEVALAEMSHP